MDIFHFREGVFLFCLFQEWENFAADKEAFSVYEEISHGGDCETYIVCYAAIQTLGVVKIVDDEVFIVFVMLYYSTVAFKYNFLEYSFQGVILEFEHRNFC